MDEQSYLNKINELEKENAILKERLKNYTAPKRSKKFYENHKEVLLEKMKLYKPTPEKIKETNKKAYLKRKEKLKELETVESTSVSI